MRNVLNTFSIVWNITDINNELGRLRTLSLQAQLNLICLMAVASTHIVLKAICNNKFIYVGIMRPLQYLTPRNKSYAAKGIKDNRVLI